jgi:diguanylate cyclase (GGDEF)-like protein/PAS domain S-box-containing protein
VVKDAETATSGATVPATLDLATLQAAIDSMLDPYVLLQAVRGADGEIVDFTYLIANEAACAFNLRRSEDFIGARLLEIHPAAGTTGLLDGYRAIVETGAPLILDDWAYPQDLMGGEERRYDVRAVKIGDGVSQTWRDVTDRYRDALLLQEAEQEYRLLAENAGDVVVRTRNGVALWISPSVTDQLGWDREELIGTDLMRLVHPDDRRMIEAAREAGVAPGTSNRLRYRVLNAAGGWSWMETVTRMWVSDDGRMDGAVGTMRNIDAEMAAVAELRSSQALNQAVVRAVGEGVMVVATDGAIVAVNPACERILSASEESLIGGVLADIPWHFADIPGPDAREADAREADAREADAREADAREADAREADAREADAREADAPEADGPDAQVGDLPLQESLRSGEPVRGLLLRLPRADGVGLWLVVSAEPVSDPSGGQFLVVSFTDVTRWRQAEEQLAAEHERLELVLSSIGLGTWDWNVPEDSIEFDQGWSLLTGHDVVGPSCLKLRQWSEEVHPDDRAEVNRVLSTCLKGNASVYDLEYRARLQSGDWVWIRERGHVLERDASGAAIHLMGTLEGIDELKVTQAALTASEAHYRMLAENASSIVTHADLEGNLLWVSPSIERLLGWRAEDLLGADVAHILHPDDLDVVKSGRDQVRRGGETSFEVRARNPAGDYHWFKLLLRPTFDATGAVTGRVAGWHDIDAEHRNREELARSREQLQFLATHDPLTGVLNRREFTSRCEAILADPQRTVGILFVDVDDFKPVNDTHGHAVGDVIIRSVARRIAECCREALTARFGGDEFLVLLPQTVDDGRLLDFAHRIEAAVAKPIVVDDVTVSLSVSIGAARSAPGQTVDSLIGHADAALYESKRAGRARSSLYRSGVAAAAADAGAADDGAAAAGAAGAAAANADGGTAAEA